MVEAGKVNGGYTNIPRAISRSKMLLYVHELTPRRLRCSDGCLSGTQEEVGAIRVSFNEFTGELQKGGETPGVMNLRLHTVYRPEILTIIHPTTT